MHALTALILAQAETSTATWAVLMVVVSGLLGGMFLLHRLMANKLSKAEDKVDAAQSKAADARHSEMKTLVGHVGDDVKAFDHRMGKVEGRMTEAEIKHGQLHQIVKSLKGGAG